MKRIIFALVAIFTLIGNQSNAQTIAVDIASVSGAVGDVVSVPVMVQLPFGTTLTQCQGSFTSSDPNVAEILDAVPTDPIIGTQVTNPGQVNFLGIGGNFTGGLFMTIEVKIKAEGCSDILLSDIVNGGSTTPVTFVAGGVVYDDLAIDFNVTDGKVCGDPLPPCDPNDLTLWPIMITQGTSFDCSDYTISVDPVVDCNGVLLNGLYSFVVVDYVGNTIAQVDNTQSTSIPVSLPYQAQFFVVVQFTYVDINGVTQIVSQPASFFYAGCTIPCDPNDLTLGPINISEGTSFDCSDYTVGVPPISGCGSTILNGAYTFTVTDFAGNTIAFVENTQSTSIPVSLPYQAQFFVSVQYTYFDINGVSQTVNVGTNFFYAGCDCPTMSPPTNLLCNPGINPLGGGQLLTWDAVPAAFSYDIQIVYNDPKCCTTIGPIQSVIMISTNNWLNMSAATCFSWRVRGECANGTKTAWSPVSCSCKLTGGHGGSKSALQPDGERITDESLKLTAVPNPASNQVNITLTGWSNEIMINQPEIIIYEISGKVVYQSEIAMDETKTVDLSSFTSGIYIINIIDNNVLLSTEKLIVE